MTKDELYELMEDGSLGYACVFKRENQGGHTDFVKDNSGYIVEL